ncbi:MAG: hypothetical protein HY010_16810 [Acidobacteria bacterium]|nr:hypothetical protein [Acidobacteriota bacterium]
MNYSQEMVKAGTRLNDLIEERQRIDTEITLLKNLLKLYVSLSNVGRNGQLAELINQVPAEAGITNAVKQVLRGSKIPLSASEIKSGLVEIGFSLDNYANSSAVIHNTLARLVKQREVMRVENPAGQTVAYVLRSGIQAPQQGKGFAEVKK